MSEPVKLSSVLMKVLQDAVDRAIEAGNPPNPENAAMLADGGLRIPEELLPEHRRAASSPSRPAKEG